MMWSRRVKQLHFVGIGGAGMSGMSEILKAMGFTITGSDIAESETVDHIRSVGIPVHIGHTPRHVDGADVVVISSAVTQDNPEVRAAHDRGIPVILRAEMLGELMRLKFSIGVAGTHGKTTTTSMVGQVLVVAGLDPTVIVGGRLISRDANAHLGESDYLVAEADEFDRSFLCLHPTVALATNLEADHLDCYSGLPDLQDNFVEYFSRVPFYGSVLTNADSPALAEVAGRIRRRHRTFGFGVQADVQARALQLDSRSSTFELWCDGEKLGSIRVALPGRHNAENALAACAVALEIDVPFAAIQEGIGSFTGVGRRFEVLGNEGQITVVDDYAHHPTEVSAALAAGRLWLEGQGRLIAVFQPHLFSRTRDFYREFADALAAADCVVLPPIYPAREKPVAGVTSALIAERLETQMDASVCRLAGSLEDAEVLVSDMARPGDLVMTIGAGSIYHLGPRLLTRLATIGVAP